MALRRKRLKVAVACIPCRRKKVKCDGSTPACKCCRESRQEGECSYAKRADLESSTGRQECSSDNLHISRISKTSIDTNEFHNPPVESYSADSMNGVTGDPDETQEVFGNSSAGAFMRQLQAAVDSRLGSSQPITSRSESESRKRASGRDDAALPSSAHPSFFPLPPRGLADALIRAYWDHHWALYPVINRGQVEEAYDSLWSPTSLKTPSHSLASIINTCLAIGCHYCDILQPKERKATGDDFFSHAEHSWNRIAGFPSIENVQCLLLFGIYLQSTSRIFQCWMAVGQAIRMAQSLGIHDPQTPLEAGSILKREYQRRTWHCCVWLNCVLSATLGRPGMIQKWLVYSIPLPSMIDDEFFERQDEGSPIRPDRKPCIMAFIVKAMELYRILDDILINLYLTPPGIEQQEMRLTHILELDGRIQDWRKSLPLHLQHDPAPDNDPLLRRQTMVLRIRFLHVRVLLFRPAVASYFRHRDSMGLSENLRNSNNSSISDVMLFECSQMCFRFAHELIDTYSRHLDPEKVTGPLPNWWYSVLYVYTAATIILIQRFLETRENSTEQSTTRQIWNNALHVLKCYSIVAEQPKRCIMALEILSQRLAFDSATNNGNEKIYPPGENKLDQDMDLGFEAPLPTDQQLDVSMEDLFSLWIDDSIWMNSVPGH